MKPVEINNALAQSVIGQEESLRYVSVAIFKHLQGEKYGNLLLIGNSGTGKTTIMRGIEALYDAHEEFSEYRVVLIMNANTFATEEGAVDTSRLFARLEERTRQVLGNGATAEQIGRAMERATVCLDEIDKVSGMIGGKPYVTGINIQQAVLTLIEGERVPHRITAPNADGLLEASSHLDRHRQDALPLRRRLRDPLRPGLPARHLAQERHQAPHHHDLRQRQDHHPRVLHPPPPLPAGGPLRVRHAAAVPVALRQRRDPGGPHLARPSPASSRSRRDGVLQTSQNFFRKYDIELEITDDAVQKIAEEASKSSRIGARALKSVYGRIIKPFEFDPFSPRGGPAGQRRRRAAPAGDRRQAGQRGPEAGRIAGGIAGTG